MSFNNIGVMLPSKIVEVFQHLSLGNDRLRPVSEIFQNPELSG